MERLKLETSNFVYGLTMSGISLPMSNCSQSWRGHGHATHFYILDLENFATADCWCTGVTEAIELEL